MGRWAQSRRRGRASDQGNSFPLSPPAGEDWILGTDGSSEGVGTITLGVCAVGADSFRFAAALDPAVDPDAALHQLAADCGSNAVINLGTLEPGNVINGWVRWTLAGVDVSDWSAMQQVTVTP